MKEYKPGELFGELALLYNAPRAANIVAKTDCTLWCLDRNTFNHIVKSSAMYPYTRNVYRKKREKYEAFLKSTQIFSTMDGYEMTKIVDAAKPASFKAGSYIIKEVRG